MSISLGILSVVSQLIMLSEQLKEYESKNYAITPNNNNITKNLKHKRHFDHTDVLNNNSINIERLTIKNIGLESVSIKFDFWNKLTRINLSKNKLLKVPNLRKLETLLYLDVSHNNINEFPRNIPDSLLNLNLKNNRLGNIVEIYKSYQSSKLKSLLSLLYLNINQNNITKMILIPEDFPNLQYFHFSKNNIHEYPSNLYKFKELRNLVVPYTQVNEFHKLQNIFNVENFSSLQFIYVYYDWCFECLDKCKCIKRPDVSLFQNLKYMKWGEFIFDKYK